MPVTRPALAAAVSVLLAAAAPGLAAADPLPVPAIAQYIETVPTSEGGAVAGRKPLIRALPSTVARKVTEEGGRDAAVLSTIATSSTYGAPQTSLPARPPAAKSAQPVKKAQPQKPAPKRPAALPAASATRTVSAGAGGGGSRLTGLLVVLAALSASLAFAGIRGRG